jgi:hypothetical protein
VGRLFSVLLLGCLMVGCQNATHPVFSPVPSPSPHTEATAAILQSGDVPAGLSVCLGSGPIDVYLANLALSNAILASRESDQWQLLHKQGATQGAISIFAASPSACSVELGATTSVKATASFVARFADEGEADRAWQTGIFGFAPPPPGQLTPGLVRGSSTGLGISSFTYERPSVRLASWHRSIFVALVVVSNLDLNTFKAATAAVDPRLN